MSIRRRVLDCGSQGARAEQSGHASRGGVSRPGSIEDGLLGGGTEKEHAHALKRVPDTVQTRTSLLGFWPDCHRMLEHAFMSGICATFITADSKAFSSVSALTKKRLLATDRPKMPTDMENDRDGERQIAPTARAPRRGRRCRD